MIATNNNCPTRDFGLLEGLLAKKRANVADSLIPTSFRGGRILDIGCGNNPVFLRETVFSEKYGLDKSIGSAVSTDLRENEIRILVCDLEKDQHLPFNSGFFDVVTMLASIEHLDSQKVKPLIGDICRVLKMGGVFILTTPSPLARVPLQLMSRLRLVSDVEIKDHKSGYNSNMLRSILSGSGFSSDAIFIGHFEVCMNIWATALKT